MNSYYIVYEKRKENTIPSKDYEIWECDNMNEEQFFKILNHLRKYFHNNGYHITILSWQKFN